MAKKVLCDICGRSVHGWTDDITEIADGKICLQCLHKMGTGGIYNSKEMTLEYVREKIAFSETFTQKTPDVDVSDWRHRIFLYEKDRMARVFLGIDEPLIKRKFARYYNFAYSDLVDYWVFVVQDPKQKTKRTGMGRALVGGALFGGTGAIAGAMTGQSTTTMAQNVTEVQVNMAVQTADRGAFTLQISIGFRETLAHLEGCVMEPEDVAIAESTARRCIEALRHILPNPPSKQKIIELGMWPDESAPTAAAPTQAAAPESAPTAAPTQAATTESTPATAPAQTVAPEPTPTAPAQAPASTQAAAEEILTYKRLLDAGAITQEEYDAKKKQLLGL